MQALSFMYGSGGTERNFTKATLYATTIVTDTDTDTGTCTDTGTNNDTNATTATTITPPHRHHHSHSTFSLVLHQQDMRSRCWS